MSEKRNFNLEQPDQLLLIATILSLPGKSRATVYRQIKGGTFPKPVKISGKRAVGWLKEDLIAWENNLKK